MLSNQQFDRTRRLALSLAGIELVERRRELLDRRSRRLGIRSGAADFIEANQAALRPLFAGDAWPQFEKLVQGYSFAEAQASLEQALKQMPGD